MTARPTTMWLRLKRRMGCDGNPMRRRSDVIAAWLTPAALVLFVAFIPIVATLTDMWVRSGNLAALRAEGTWHPVTATLVRSAPGPAQPDHGANTWNEPVLARWTANGRTHTGLIPVSAGSTAGSTHTVLLDRAGHVHAPPLTSAQVADRADTTTFIVMAVLALLLMTLKGIARRMLDKRRLAAWESGWLAVGPRWSHQG